ncbi:hypothetical protein K227x_63240 [Rubripirellula lacrimiformis]|uniref:Sulfate exporter family transporter n=1 Tax=Rubripirellula lacrimiformis TaxID=1930273 RepID=A0A517NL79_9BACT|nr:putative sulfate exporter family transporter [Rubripirellula lacrimiformis]QDT07895.1 hypothetical protein K227x_63240 [Rubripirellula lacrimiformis]
MSTDAPNPRHSTFREMKTAEDWWAIWCGGLLLLLSFGAVWISRPADLADQVQRAADAKSEIAEAKAAGDDGLAKQIAADTKVTVSHPWKAWFAKPGSWESNPVDSVYRPPVQEAEEREAQKAVNAIGGLVGVFIVLGVLFAVAQSFRGHSAGGFLKAFPVVFLLAMLAYVLAGQVVVKSYNLEYALWALLVGLIISNTVGTPKFLGPAVLTEFYIKTGLVLLGAEVLMSRLLVLGLPGICVAWVVTPIVLISTFIFGQKVLKIQSPSLNMVISADMSVCGVSAAIATAAACKAKKEELSLAIGLSLSFTVIMMVVLPAIIKAVGMDEVLGGAWLGGTIDATGAVAAAGAVLGDRALEVAATVKMIQNILIGITAFGVAIYWVTCVEKNDSGIRPDAMEIWYRFPKFVLGFVAASVIFSLLYSNLVGGPAVIDAMIGGSTKTLRGWLFCLAFVSIGLQTNFRELAPHLKGGKPLILYVCGQTLNLVLTLAMAWLMFRVVFRDQIDQYLP